MGAPVTPDLATPEFAGLETPAFAGLATGGGPPPTDPTANQLATPGTAQLGLSDAGKRNKIVAMAMSYIGVPYVWGGTGPKGFDCSGLVQFVFGKNGVQLPRVSNQQANSGQRVTLKDLQVGDLVAWDENSRNNGADHIAIYAGNGMVIEAPHTGANVRFRALGSNEGAYGVHLTY